MRGGAGAPESLCEWCLEAQRHRATRAVVEKWLGKKAGSLDVGRIVENGLFSELLYFCCGLGCAEDIHSNNWRDSRGEKEQFMCNHCS